MGIYYFNIWCFYGNLSALKSSFGRQFDIAWPWTSRKMTFQTEFNNDFKDFKSQIDNLQGQLCTFMDNCFDKEIFFTLALPQHSLAPPQRSLAPPPHPLAPVEKSWKATTTDQVEVLINRFKKLNIACLEDEIKQKWEVYCKHYLETLHKIRRDYDDCRINGSY